MIEVISMINRMNFNEMWNKITHVFNILKDEYEDNNCTENEYNEVLNIIIHLKFVNNIENLIFSRLAKHLRQNIIPKFWAHFSKTDSCYFTLFQTAVHDLYFDLSVHIPLITKLDKLRKDSKSTSLIFGFSDSLSAFKLLVRSTLLSQLPPDYTKTVVSFYEDAFRAFCNLDEESSDEDNNCTGCLQEMPMCRCQQICCIFYDTNRRLVDLDLLEPLVGQVLTSLIHVRIENHILQVSKNSYDTHYVEILEKWLNTVVITWLERIYCIDSVVNQSIRDNMDKFKQKLTFFLIETYTKTRINQLFNIIIEYPESQAAVEDLHACLPKTNLRPYLISTLQNSLQTRLLHPGVSTPDILTAYVAVIRSIRVLDPSGVLLDTVTQPLHAYLRGRDDTVRCVVGSLSEEGPNDLADELVRGEALHLDDHDNEEEDSSNWETWNPDPVHVDKTKRRNKRTSDIISMLVNVYGSKELFVNEYRTLLADRLLTQFLDSTEKEIRYLELLKLRFGETQLHYCEVMLKDISHSKRINTHLQNDEEYIQLSQQFPMSALILSAQFWPVFKDETLELPEIIKEQFKYYTTAFETLKGNRTLCWKPHLGTVELDIELKDRTLNLSVSPLHATIIMHFQNKNQWTIDELSQIMKVPATLLRKKINFWQSQGVLQEISTDVFLLIEDSKTSKEKVQNSDIVLEDDESESAMASSQDQREEELQVFWSYIIGMLTNLDSMPLERIHQMLKMFASQGPTAIECSLQELRHFLDRKVREHKLTCQGGFYRLPKT